MPKEDRPRIREAHATRRPHEERRSQLVLQLTDLAAHGGLGNTELLRRASNVTLFGYGDEVLDLGEAHIGQRTSKGQG